MESLREKNAEKLTVREKKMKDATVWEMVKCYCQLFFQFLLLFKNNQIGAPRWLN